MKSNFIDRASVQRCQDNCYYFYSIFTTVPTPIAAILIANIPILFLFALCSINPLLFIYSYFAHSALFKSNTSSLIFPTTFFTL